jgi:tetratricopeptide (TPR) repeat protein
MKNKTSMRNQPDASLPTSDEQLIDFVKKNKSFLIGAVVAAIVSFAVALLYVNYSKNQEEEAWAKYAEVVSDANEVAALREVLSSIEGSSAEPWVLYRLSIIEFTANNLDAAKEAFDSLEKSYGDHYIFANPKLAPSYQAKLEAELLWRNNHPLAKVAPEETKQPENTEPPASTEKEPVAGENEGS